MLPSGVTLTVANVKVQCNLEKEEVAARMATCIGRIHTSVETLACM